MMLTNWNGCLAGCLLAAGALAQAPAASRDTAHYKEFNLLEREIQEEDARDRARAERKGVAFKPSERKPEKRLTLDFSRLDRPRGKEEFALLGHMPPKRQWWTGNCWCFAATSLMESEVLRQSGREIKLSEMHTVYWEFVEKAREFVRTKGASLFDEGSESEALLLRWKQYGAVPESAYTGLPGGTAVFDQGPMMEEALGYLTMVKEGGHWDESIVTGHIRTILDRHLGAPPATVRVDGKDLTPQDYVRDVLRINPDDYVEFMSTLEAPFWTKAEFKVPDNYWHSTEYHNVPLEDWYAGLRQAIEAGYSVAVGGDTSEVGYDSSEDVGIVPTFDIPGEFIDQAAREFRFANKTTADDHGLHLVGHKRMGDRDWYLAKDSGRSGQRGVPGYYFYRDDYVRLKMLTFLVHKDGARGLLARYAEKAGADSDAKSARNESR